MMSKKTLSNQRRTELFIEKWSDIDCSVENLKFYIMSFNILCQISKTEYIPVEVGVTRYSIKQGIEDSFHSFINPGPVPKGYMGISKDISDSTHKIPIVGFDLTDRDYAKLYQSVIDFIRPKEEVIVFCTEEEIQQNKSCFNWLYKKSKSNNDFPIQIYNVALLLMRLSECGSRPFRSKQMAANVFNCHAFDYLSNTRCNFHEDLDNDFCALARTKRLCFILSTNLCKLFKIFPTENHIHPKMTNYQVRTLNFASVSNFTRSRKKKSFEGNHPRKIETEDKQSYQNVNNNQQNYLPRQDLFRYDTKQSKPFSNTVPDNVTPRTQTKTQLSATFSEVSSINTDNNRCNSRDKLSRQPFSLPKVLTDDPNFRSLCNISTSLILRQPNSMPMVLRAIFEDFH